MPDFELLTDINTAIPPRDITGRIVDVLIDTADQDDAADQLRQIARDLLTGDVLAIHAYIEREAVKWQGWIARVEYRRGGVPLVFFDNDPILREAIYRDMNDSA